MDNTGITHNGSLRGYGRRIQSYVETGRIRLDFNGDIESCLSLDEGDAETLIALLQMALADKAR